MDKTENNEKPFLGNGKSFFPFLQETQLDSLHKRKSIVRAGKASMSMSQRSRKYDSFIAQREVISQTQNQFRCSDFQTRAPAPGFLWFILN